MIQISVCRLQMRAAPSSVLAHKEEQNGFSSAQRLEIRTDHAALAVVRPAGIIDPVPPVVIVRYRAAQ
jgi:hypothetical protein